MHAPYTLAYKEDLSAKYQLQMLIMQMQCHSPGKAPAKDGSPLEDSHLVPCTLYQTVASHTLFSAGLGFARSHDWGLFCFVHLPLEHHSDELDDDA